jgi:hypothetical protein
MQASTNLATCQLKEMEATSCVEWVEPVSQTVSRTCPPAQIEGLIRAFADTFDEIVTKLCLRLRSEVEEYEATLAAPRPTR